MAKKKPPLKIDGQANADARHPETYNYLRIAIVVLVIVAIACGTILIYPAIYKIITESSHDEIKGYIFWGFTAVVMPILGGLLRPYVDKFLKDD